MPSHLHESLLELFRVCPELAPTLMRDCLGVELPAYTEARTDSADFTQLAPTEYHADLVVLLVAGKPVLGIVLEAQLRRDPRKRFTWPLYATTLRARFECDVCVLVVAPTEDVERWARQPIRLGPSSTFTPVVLGRSSIPMVTDPEQALRAPELAVLSVMAHGESESKTAARVAAAAAAGARALDDERAVIYWDMIWAALSKAAKKEFLMIRQGYQFRSDFALKYLAEGEAKGVAKGEARGRAEGEAAAKAADVLEVLDARGLHVSESQRERITSCADLALLSRWHRRAVTADTADAVFD